MNAEKLAFELTKSINQANIAENKAKESEKEAKQLREKIEKLDTLMKDVKVKAD